MLMSSFVPVTALANLGTEIQNTLAAGNRVLDILDVTPIIVEKQMEKTSCILEQRLAILTLHMKKRRYLRISQ